VAQPNKGRRYTLGRRLAGRSAIRGVTVLLLEDGRPIIPVENQGYIIDNSVLQKVTRSPNIYRRFDEITSRYPIFTCPPQVLEYCFSARNPKEYEELRQDVDLYTPAPIVPDQSAILDIQQALWNGGKMRAAGPVDTIIAAYAIANDLTVLCSDHDFEYIASVLDPGVLKIEYLSE